MAYLINMSQGTKLDHTDIQKQACSTHYVSSPHLGQWSTIYKAPDMMKAGKCIALTIASPSWQDQPPGAVCRQTTR